MTESINEATHVISETPRQRKTRRQRERRHAVSRIRYMPNLDDAVARWRADHDATDPDREGLSFVPGITSPELPYASFDDLSPDWLSAPFKRGKTPRERDAYRDFKGRLTRSGVFVWELNARLLRNADRGYDVQFPVPIGSPCPLCGGKHRVCRKPGYYEPMLSADLEQAKNVEADK